MTYSLLPFIIILIILLFNTIKILNEYFSMFDSIFDDNSYKIYKGNFLNIISQARICLKRSKMGRDKKKKNLVRRVQLLANMMS